MKPQYITLVGTTPEIVALNTNTTTFDLSIRATAGVTIEFALENPNDSTADTSKAAAGPAPTWVAAPNAVNANGVLHITGTPYAAVRFTPAAGGVATVLQQGVV